jgi:predicted permease
MDWLRQDVRYAARTLGKSPGFTVVAIATLALAVGASTTVFTLVHSIILRPLAYRDPGSLVVIWERVPSLSAEPTGPNPRHFDIWRKRATAFADLTMLRHSTGGLTLGAEHPQLIGTVNCLPNLFTILGVVPLLGRTFVPEDGVKGRDTSVIISYSLWQALFIGRPDVIGQTVRIADVPREVVGVLPESFHFPNANALRAFRSGQAASNVPEPAVFLPVAIDPTQFGWNGDYGNWLALGRLLPGISARQAEAQMTTIQAEIAQEMPASARDSRGRLLQASVEPMQHAIVQDARLGLWLLMAAVIGLMMIACLNLTNAQIARALSRRREGAIRIALGATGWRAVSAAFAENLLLATAGSASGILLAAAGVRLFRRHSPIDLPRLAEIDIDRTVLLFSIGVGAAAMLLSGLLPALTFLRCDPQASLQQNNTRSLGGRQNRQVRSWLIGLQVAGCTVLLMITALFAQSLLRLLREEKGFDTRNVAIAEVRLSPKTYGTDRSRISFNDAVLENLRRIPGVENAGLVSVMPLEGESWIEGLHRADRPTDEVPLINLRWVSPGYFETVREPIIAGRSFEERDRNLHSAVVSEGEAKALFGGDDPIGREIITQGRTFSVIGVVADSRNTSLKSAPVRTAYLHYTDRPPYVAFLLARGPQPLDALMSTMRQAIWNYAPDLTIARVNTLDAQLKQSLALERFQTLVLLAFGAAALLLAMLGIYGVLAYSVATRRQEIGLRVALGATQRAIYSLTFREAGYPLIGGIAFGLAASVVSQAFILKAVYGITAIDPSLGLVVAALLVSSASAAAFPALRRAVSIDPIDTLRAE